jgi:hypothetical protein
MIDRTFGVQTSVFQTALNGITFSCYERGHAMSFLSGIGDGKVA